MSLLFIYSLINYYTAFSSLTLKPSLGGATVQRGRVAEASGCAETPGRDAPPRAELAGQRRASL